MGFKFNNNKWKLDFSRFQGFSLVEILVVMGISSGLSLGVVYTIDMQQRAGRDFDQRIEINSYQQMIGSFFMNSTACKNTLNAHAADMENGNLPKEINQLVDQRGNTYLSTGTKIGPSKMIEVGKITLHDYDSTLGAEIQIEFIKKTGVNSTPITQTIVKRVPVFITGGVISECNASNDLIEAATTKTCEALGGSSTTVIATNKMICKDINLNGADFNYAGANYDPSGVPASLVRAKGATIGGNATIVGNTTIGANDAIARTLNIYGATTIGSNANPRNMTIHGNMTMGQAGSNRTLTVHGDTTIGSSRNLTVSGNTTLQGTASITGDTTVGGNLSVTGAATIDSTFMALQKSRLMAVDIDDHLRVKPQLYVHGDLRVFNDAGTIEAGTWTRHGNLSTIGVIRANSTVSSVNGDVVAETGFLRGKFDLETRNLQSLKNNSTHTYNYTFVNAVFCSLTKIDFNWKEAEDHNYTGCWVTQAGANWVFTLRKSKDEQSLDCTVTCIKL